MRSFLLQVVAVISGLVLALPPGWCASFMPHGRSEPASVATTCCHQTSTDCAPKSGQVPLQPTVKCCCQRDATVPEKPVQPPDGSAVAVVPTVEAALVSTGSGQVDAVGDWVAPGPRLHVLQCVWRC